MNRKSEGQEDDLETYKKSLEKLHTPQISMETTAVKRTP